MIDNDREDKLHRATLWQRAARLDATHAARAFATAQNACGSRRADLLSDAAAFQQLAAKAHRNAVALMVG